MGRREESAQAYADCIACFEVKSGRHPSHASKADCELPLTIAFSTCQGMTFDVRDEKADAMMNLNATLVALHASCGNARGVDRAVSYLESVGIARAEAEEVGAINFKALQEGILSAELSHLTQFLSVFFAS